MLSDPYACCEDSDCRSSETCISGICKAKVCTADEEMETNLNAKFSSTKGSKLGQLAKLSSLNTYIFKVRVIRFSKK